MLAPEYTRMDKIWTTSHLLWIQNFVEIISDLLWGSPQSDTVLVNFDYSAYITDYLFNTSNWNKCCDSNPEANQH